MRFLLLLSSLVGLLTACSPASILNATVPSRGFVVTRDVAYGEGARARLDIYRPKDVAAPAPVIVFFYGGGWDGGSKDMYRFAAEAFTSRGFVVVIPDYRLYPEVRFPDFLKDCAAAVAWTADHIAAYGGRPDAIMLVGHSAGAYNAAMLALDPGYLAAAGYDRTKIRAFVGLAGPYDFFPFDVKETRQAFGNTPDTSLTQPVYFATRDAPPILLLHGEADETVYLRNSRNLADKLRAAGADVTLKTYPGMGHARIVLSLAAAFRTGATVREDAAGFLSAHVPRQE